MSQSRTIELRYTVNLAELGPEKGKVDIWLPFPEEAPHQERRLRLYSGRRKTWRLRAGREPRCCHRETL